MTVAEDAQLESTRLDQEFRRGYDHAIEAVLEQLRADQYLLADDEGNLGETTRAVVAYVTLSILNLQQEVQREWAWQDRLDYAVRAAKMPSTLVSP